MEKLSDLDLTKTYTYADYLTWRFDETIELIRGRIFKMPPAPNRKHQAVSHELCRVFSNYFKGKPSQFYSAPFDVRLPRKGEKVAYTVVQPDLCVICDPAKLDDLGCVGAPDLVVEILSPGNSRKEMREKYEVYEEAGVREYWLVNPADHTVLVYVLNDAGKFIGLQPYTEDAQLAPQIFPELAIDLMDVFGED